MSDHEQLIGGYLAGSLDGAQDRELMAVLASDPGLERELIEGHRLDRLIEVAMLPAVDPDAFCERVMDRVRPRTGPSPRTWLIVAAVSTLTLITVLGGWNWHLHAQIHATAAGPSGADTLSPTTMIQGGGLIGFAVIGSTLLLLVMTIAVLVVNRGWRMPLLMLFLAALPLTLGLFGTMIGLNMVQNAIAEGYVIHPAAIEEKTSLAWGTTYMGIAGTVPLALIAGMGLMFKLGNRPE